MKKLTIAVLIVSVAALVFAGAAFAQTETPFNPGRGNGGNGGNGGGGTTPNYSYQMDDGWLHDYMVEYYAAALGMDASVLDARMSAGESLTTIASALGYTADEIAALMDAARVYALDSALTAGIITQLQYDQMIDNGTVMGATSNNGSTTGSSSNYGSGTSTGRNNRGNSGSRPSTGTGSNLQDGSCITP